MSAPQPLPHFDTARALKSMIDGYRLSQMIYVAAKLQIADCLAAGPMTVDKLAVATGSHASSLHRLMRALASFGIFAEGQDGHFQLTPLATGLQRTVQDSQWAFAISIGEAWGWAAWERLLKSVQTGETAFCCLHGQGLFEYLNSHPASAEVFNENMRAMTQSEAHRIVAAYDFSRSQVIADIGGGTGALISAILESHAGVRAILFDDTAVLPAAHAYLTSLGIAAGIAAGVAGGIAGRCTLVPGSFFQSIPAGADTYLLKDILHDWDDQHAIRLLRNVRAAISAGANLLVIERLITPDNEPSESKALDIVMLVLTGGKERTAEQYAELLTSAGFSLRRIIPAGFGISVMEATPN